MENFKIISKIGKGAYSTVYKVQNLKDNNHYALKKVNLRNLSKKEIENALNEVSILSSVKSEYIISYKDSFIDETDSTLCIIMEYADEGDLQKKITLYKKLKKSFLENDIWRIFIQITKGLKDLHDYNILHRDLKSANIFLFKDGTVKIGDLNVSKITSRGLGCTQTGTPFYASPEVWKDNPYNCKSDIWSLGCVLYEICMLSTPFVCDNMKGLFNKIMKGKFKKINEKYSIQLNSVVEKLIVVKSDCRPSAKEILEFKDVKDKICEFDILNDIFFGKNNFKTIHNKENNIISKDNSFVNCENNNNIINNDENNEEKLKIVLDNIRIPKKFNVLNKKLSEVNYGNDENCVENVDYFFSKNFNEIRRNNSNKDNNSLSKNILPFLKVRNNLNNGNKENYLKDDNESNNERYKNELETLDISIIPKLNNESNYLKNLKQVFLGKNNDKIVNLKNNFDIILEE